MTDFYTYENLDLLKKRLGVSSSFYLIYSVGSKDDKYLKKIAQECATDASCLGVDFCIEKEEHFFDDLFFLRGIVREFLDLDKKVGLWGIPRCVCRRLLGGYYFMKFLCFEIGENNPSEGVPERGEPNLLKRVMNAETKTLVSDWGKKIFLIISLASKKRCQKATMKFHHVDSNPEAFSWRKNTMFLCNIAEKSIARQHIGRSIMLKISISTPLIPIKTVLFTGATI